MENGTVQISFANGEVWTYSLNNWVFWQNMLPYATNVTIDFE